MSVLKIPYVKQINPRACGVAAFGTVFRSMASRLSKFNQEKTYRRLCQLHRGDYVVATDDIVALANEKNYQAGWGRVSPDAQEALQ